MFRPGPLVGYAPIRLAGAVGALSILLLAVAVFIGADYERAGLIADGGRARAAWPPWSPGGVVAAAGALLVLAAASIVLLSTALNARTMAHAFERVKSLMRNILESIPTGVLTLDASGTVTSINGAAARLLELRGSAVVGRHVADSLQAIGDLADWIREVRGAERLVQERDLLLSVSPGRRLTIRASAAELRDEAGHPEGLVVLLRDVTDVNHLEAQLRRADKLAALGTLAAGVAHEIKNPLYALGLNLHLLEGETLGAARPSGEAKGYMAILRSELERLDQIVENFLRFSKPSMPEVKDLDLEALLDRVLGLIACEAAGHGATIRTSFDPALRSVPGDEGQLSQVFLNLGINALQAMPCGGTLAVSTRLARGWAEVSIGDSGPGIQEDVVPHIFDPYFTTRPHGVGLGLAIAHRIVESHGGSIEVETEAGQGTIMTVRLPLAAPLP
jgi:PAS domain S-box-containing protein